MPAMGKGPIFLAHGRQQGENSGMADKVTSGIAGTDEVAGAADTAQSGHLPGPKPMAPIPRYDPVILPDRRRDPDQSGGAVGAVAGQNTGIENFSVAGIEGRIDRRKANVASRVVDSDPEQALRVIRSWLGQG